MVPPSDNILAILSFGYQPDVAYLVLEATIVNALMPTRVYVRLIEDNPLAVSSKEHAAPDTKEWSS